MAKKKKTKLTHKLKGVPVRTQLAIVTGAVCLLALFGVFVAWLDTQVDIRDYFKRSYDKSVTFGDVIIRGESTCLKHKGSGPHTEECAIGIKTPSGDYAVIGEPTQQENEIIEARGLLSPSSRDSIYDTQGTLTVQ